MRDNDKEGIINYKFIDFGSAINIDDCSNFIENKGKHGLTTKIWNSGTMGYLDKNMYSNIFNIFLIIKFKSEILLLRKISILN